MRFPGCTTIASVLLFAAPAGARDPLLDHFEGTWGTPGTLASCQESSATIHFSADGSEMRLSYSSPVEGPGGALLTEAHYKVVAVAGSSVRMKFTGETRTTDDGDLVVWDLVRLSKDAYCWHRADWELGVCTPPRIRCDSLLDDFEALMRERSSSVLEMMSRGRFEEAAGLFALPPGFPEGERNFEYRRLADSLAVILRELGDPANWSDAVQDQRDVPELVNVSVGPSHVIVAQEHGNFFFTFFRVDFAVEGPGFFRAAFDAAGQVLQMTFSLPREKSERMAEIGSILLRETAHEL